VTLLMKTKSAELGYAIDSKLYGIPEYVSYVQTALRKMKHEDVQKAIRKHLRADRLEIVGVSDNAAALRDALLADGASPMTYNAAKPADILAEDKIVSVKKLGLTAEQVTVVGIDRVFQ
jgi:zinc protease